MRRIAAACIVAICAASTGSAADLVTKAPSQELISQNSTSLQSSQASNQQSFVFGDWGGLRSWLNDRGIDLGFGYLSESAWNIAGGKARGGTYAGQENLSLDVDWEKLAKLNGFSTHLDFVSRQGQNVSTEFVGDVLSKPSRSTARLHLSGRTFTWLTSILSNSSLTATLI